VSFLSAAFLFGLAATAIPVVIHLIYRQRYPERPFTTLRFFDKTIKNNTIQTRLIDKLLLLLRVLALAALMIGLARPFVSHGTLGEERASIVIVLDNSPSMERTREGKTLFERAQAIAQTALDNLGPSDRVELLFTAPSDEPVFYGDPADVRRELAVRAGEPTGLWLNEPEQAKHAVPGLTRDGAQLDAALAALPPGSKTGVLGYDSSRSGNFGYDAMRLRQLLSQAHTSARPGDVKAALTHAAELLKLSQDGDKKIILISDLQKSEWLAPNANVDALSGVLLVAVPIEPEPASGANLGIESCTLPVREADFGQTITGVVTIRNYGSVASQEGKIVVHAGEGSKPIEVKVPVIPAASSLALAFPIQVLSRERNLLCSAQLVMPAPDNFSYDDAWYFQIGVRFPAQTLCVNGEAGRTGSDSEAFYIVNALGSRSSSNPAAADAKEVDITEFSDKRLTEWNVLVLAGVQTLDKDAREKIRQFAADGKGVLIFPGANTLPEELNAWGFLPAQVGEKKTKDFVFLKSIDERAPALDGFRAHAGAGIHALSASLHYVLQSANGATVLARFSDGTPALVEGAVGKGRVILAATGAHISESDWPLRPAFVLLTRDLVRYLGADARPAALLPDRIVGEGAATVIPAELANGTPAIFRVSGTSGAKAHYEPVPWLQCGRAVVLPSATREGQYYLSAQPGTSGGILYTPTFDSEMAPVSVNHSPSESNLEAIPVDELKNYLPKSTELTSYRLTDNSAPIVEALHSGRDMWRWMLLAALAVLAVEGILAWLSATEAAN
jgi:hypothetical protein